MILGWQLGLWGALFTHFMLRTSIINHVQSLSNYSNEEIWASLKKSIALLIALLSTSILEYLYFSGNSYPQEWNDNFTAKCSHIPKDYNIATFQSAGLSFVGFGAYFGLVIKCFYNNAYPSLIEPKAVFENPISPDISLKTLY